MARLPKRMDDEETGAQSRKADGAKRGRQAMEGLVGGSSIVSGKKKRKGPVKRKGATVSSKMKAVKAKMKNRGQIDASAIGGSKGTKLEFAEDMKKKYPAIDNRNKKQKDRDKRSGY